MSDNDRARDAAKRITSQLDDWISANRLSGQFPGNGIHGQRFLEELVTSAIFQARLEGQASARRAWAVERARLLDIEAQAKKVLKAHDEWLATQSSDDKAGQRGDT